VSEFTVQVDNVTQSTPARRIVLRVGNLNQFARVDAIQAQNVHFPALRLDLHASQDLPMKALLPLPLRLIVLIGCALTSLGASASPGCPWIQAYNPAGMGGVDDNAMYWDSLLPNNIAPGTQVEIDGQYPHARYFGFHIYHSGNALDHIADADLSPVEGGGTDQYVAAVPEGAAANDHYRITVKFEDVPAVREPDTLYAGSATSLGRLLMMRIYLPDAGEDQTGGVGMPQLTLIKPDGTRQRYDNVNPLNCQIFAWAVPLVYVIPLPTGGWPTRHPSFDIVPTDQYNGGSTSFARYTNFDNGFGYVATNPAFDDLLIIRAKLPATPSGPYAPQDLQVRYFSLCEYRTSDRYVLGCLADPEMTVQDDGYVNVVVTTAANKPPQADPSFGYDWMTWPDGTNKGLFVIRQQLADAGFAGNYQVASSTADPLAALGVWAPQVTYCDLQTFNSYVMNGGAALFAACQAATQGWY
jgi:hypothetical protein